MKHFHLVTDKVEIFFTLWVAGTFNQMQQVIIYFSFDKATTTIWRNSTSLEKSCCAGFFTLVSSNYFAAFNLLVGFFINRKACSRGVPKDPLEDGLFNNWNKSASSGSVKRTCPGSTLALPESDSWKTQIDIF